MADRSKVGRTNSSGGHDWRAHDKVDPVPGSAGQGHACMGDLIAPRTPMNQSISHRMSILDSYL
jgi:hypothetical protein